MEPIRGNDVLGLVNDTIIFCGTDIIFSESKSSVESTGSVGKWTYNKLKDITWSIEVNGFTKVDPTDGQMDYFSMITSPFSRDFHDITMVFTDVDGNQQSISGTMFLQKSSISGPVKEFAGASVLFIGTGAYLISGESSGSGGECVPVGASGSFDPPDGELNTPYSYTLTLTGTSPKTLGTITGKPGWMTISVGTGNLVLSGTPSSFSDVGTFFLDIIINNDCGSIHLIDEVGATIAEDGRNVFVINNSVCDVVIENSNGHQYTFLATNGSDGNIKMPTDTISIITICGFDNGVDTFEFLQDLVGGGTVINTGQANASDVIITDDLSITNYLRFTD